MNVNVLLKSSLCIILFAGCATLNSNTIANNNLLRSVERNDVSGVKLALNNGADVNARNMQGYPALIIASGANYIDLLKILIKKGADVNIRETEERYRMGLTPLLVASSAGNCDVAKILLDNGADVQKKSFVGMSAIMCTFFNKRISQHKKNEIAGLLITHGASPNQQNDKGQSLLMLSTVYGYEGNVEYLISKGADVNSRSHEGYTALIYASLLEKEDIAKLLISNGADVNAKSRVGATSLFFAQTKGYGRIVNLLRKAGARE